MYIFQNFYFFFYSFGYIYDRHGSYSLNKIHLFSEKIQKPQREINPESFPVNRVKFFV